MNPVSVRGWVFLLAMLASPAVASPNAVTEWNQQTVSCALEAKQFPFVATRTLAMVHTAMFDAMNRVEGRYPPCKFKVAAPPGSSAEAADAAAAYTVLLKPFPDQKSARDTAYAASLARVPDGNDKTSGAAVGEEVGGQDFTAEGSAFRACLPCLPQAGAAERRSWH